MKKNIWSLKFVVVGVLLVVGVLVVGKAVFWSNGDSITAEARRNASLKALLSNQIGPWTNTTPLPVAVAEASFAASGEYAYGLFDNSEFADHTVKFAAFNPNGTLGSWADTTILPEAVSDQTSIIYNDYIYSLGGIFTRSIYYAPVNPNGTIGSWASTGNLGYTALIDFPVVTNNGYMYRLGGNIFQLGERTNTVSYAVINPNGTIGSWLGTTALPNAISDHAAVISNGYLYVIGGRSSNEPSSVTSGVMYTTLNPNGTIGSWSNTTALPVPLSDHTAVVDNGYIYVVGGGTAVYYAPISANGTLGSWTSTTALPTAMFGHGSFVNNGFIYALGGMTAGSIPSDVARFAQIIGGIQSY